MTTVNELETLCRNIASAGADIFKWEWDGRFHAALSAFPAKHEIEVMQILEQGLGQSYGADTILQASDSVQAAARNMGGLRAGQMMMAAASDDGITLYCAWWPWGNGQTISIRIGCVVGAEAEAGAYDSALKSWFGL